MVLLQTFPYVFKYSSAFIRLKFLISRNCNRNAVNILYDLCSQGWYIVTYALGIYHLNLFIAFLSPKIDPALTDDGGMP